MSRSARGPTPRRRRPAVSIDGTQARAAMVCYGLGTGSLLRAGAAMRRREFLIALGGVTAWPFAARAQQAGMPVVGLLRHGSRGQSPQLVDAFHKGLRETGFVENQNVSIEYRWAE